MTNDDKFWFTTRPFFDMVYDMTTNEENEKHGPECACCKHGHGHVAEMEVNALAEYGWYAHYIFDDDETASGCNVHTHGLEGFDHLDLQVVLPIDPKVSHSIIASAIERIKQGEKFKDGDLVEDLITNNFKVKFIKAEETGREVLRLIFPDEKGNLELESLTNELYANQYR